MAAEAGAAAAAAGRAALGGSDSDGGGDGGDWSTSAGSSNIVVAVRVRPMNDKEKRLSEEVVSMVDGKLVIVRDPGHFADNIMRKARIKDRRYAFDHAFDAGCDSGTVFTHTVKHLIPGVLGGYNGTVFAYGATGSGKTFSMLGTKDCPGERPHQA